jgi:hypothetical protein
MRNRLYFLVGILIIASVLFSEKFPIYLYEGWNMISIQIVEPVSLSGYGFANLFEFNGFSYILTTKHYTV